MIFIWSTNGGPLQYVGLILFAIQAFPFLALQLNLSVSDLVGVAAGFSIAAVWYLLYTGSYQTIGNAASARCREAWELGRRIVSRMNETDRGMVLLLVCIIVGGMVSLTMYVGTEVVWSAIHLVALSLILRAQLTRGREEGIGEDDESKERRITEIVNMIQKMPIEEFVSEGKMSSCSISQLKRMLEIRGKSADDFVERGNLENAVKECRNYSETCCICYEDYNSGDLLRVLPKCRHEFHVECVDQWAYTFANKRKRAREPTCPLCNISLK